MNHKESLAAILAKAGVTLGGDAPQDVRILDDRAYGIVASGGSLAIGEAYMDKLWDCDDLSQMISRIHTHKVYHDIVSLDHWPLILRGVFSNLQSRARSTLVAKEHYDLDSAVYQPMLGPTMSYTSAVWRGVATLEEAQDQKHDMLCQKLGLKRGDRIIDIGCGWGSLMKFAAENYGVSAVGLTVSEGQTALGRELCAGLPIEFVIEDYRDYDATGEFDHALSLEMIEHVGHKNLATYFAQIHRFLKPGGRFALQNIVSHSAVPKPDRWIDRYIFPNGILPSQPQLERASRPYFNLDDVDDIGLEYDPTLMAWWHNFDAAYPEIVAANPQYDERFYRMWKFYLQSCAALFRSRTIHDWQMIYTKR